MQPPLENTLKNTLKNTRTTTQTHSQSSISILRRAVRATVRDLLIQPLEQRMMFSTTPNTVLTTALRKELLADWNGSNKATLTADLAAGNNAQFDADLLSYMQNRTDANFYFTSGQISSDLSYIQNNIGTSDITTSANDAVNHLFPKAPGSTSDTLQLPSGDINWLGTTQGDTDEYQSLNRMAWWQDLASAYQLTGNTSYSTELTNELASWSAQDPALANANTWPAHSPSWALLDTSIRAVNWTWAYSLMIGTSGWTAQANTLFLVKMAETGQFLDAATPYALNDNRAIEQYEGLDVIATVFPEFSAASTWKTFAHKELFSAMTQQLYGDGSDREQSPGYQGVVLDNLLDTKLLDQDNGYTWPAADSTLLTDSIYGYMQILSPNGDRPAIGDTYRINSSPLWLEADVVQNTTEFPAAKPRTDDVWELGTTVANEYHNNANYPALPDRGLTYAETIGGDYIMRSGSDPTSNQIIFQDGSKGGQHGHNDELGFELSGYGKPLLPEPGLVDYSGDADELYAESTPAANDISVDGLNTGDIEGINNPAVGVTQYDPESDGVQLTAYEQAYNYLAGTPTLARSIYYDYGNTMLVVDWAASTAAHTYSVGYNLPGTATLNSDDSIESTNGGGDVKITPLITSGMTFKAVNSFTSNTSDPEESPAVHYSISENGKFVAFAELIQMYNGSSAPTSTTAQILGTPSASGSFQIALTENGSTKNITFTPPAQTFPNSSGTVPSSSSSIAYDSKGTLYMAYVDSTTGHLMYTTRTSAGAWSAEEVIDNSVTASAPSIAIDGNGRPGIAYYDATDGNLNYAYLATNTNSWQITTIDSAGTTGETPSLAFSRKSGACISYYDKTTHSLKFATAATDGFTITTIDKSANVGLYSSLALDPSRPTASKFAVSYDDSTHGSVKYAIQQGSGWKIYTVDTTKKGGVTSLAFDASEQAAITYYDAKESALKIAHFSAKAKTFSSSYVATAGTVGQASSLFYTKKGVPTVFYTDATHHDDVEAVLTKGKWVSTKLKPGGSSVDAAVYGTSFAYLDGSADGKSTSVY